MIFFISDTHLFHANSLKWRRQFKSLDEMHKVIVENWNRVVSPEDTVYHLGDVFLTEAIRSKEILKSLNGNKILVRGNHDLKHNGWFKDAGFSEIHKVVYLSSPRNPGRLSYVITHYPLPYREIEALEGMGKQIINIHGHTHDSVDRSFTGNDVWNYPEKYINVSAEVVDYTPKLIDL